MKKFEITEEQIKQAYDAACEDWKQRIKEWFPEAFKQQSGWYKNDGLPNWLAYYDFENQEMYGFACDDGRWYSTINLSPLNSDYPAPKEEVEERLIEEAKRRGYKEGVSVGDVITNKQYVIGHGNFGFWIKDFADGANESSTLMMGRARIFNSGKWAEIISTPEPDEYITLNNIKYKRCN